MNKMNVLRIVLVLISVLILSEKIISSEKVTEEINKKTYSENVHAYICIEALKLLKDILPAYDYTLLNQRIGTMEEISTRHWQAGLITEGARREDMEDVVFDIRGPGGLFVSNSHFWKPDDRSGGDHSLTELEFIGKYPNAYTKVCRYLDGQWFAWNGSGYAQRIYINYLSGNTVNRFSYHTRGLINFFKTKRLWHHSSVNTLGEENIIDQEITVTDNFRNLIVFEALGGMLHLIQDMTVPCHTHNDVHVRDLDGGDCYHNYIDDGGYNNFDWQTAKNTGGFMNPYGQWNDPVRYIMYLSNQLADHYPSGPECLEIPQQHSGNNNLPGGTYPLLNSFYQQLGEPPQNITNPYIEGTYCFNQAIRSSAAMLYWFGVETGIFPPDAGAVPVINSITKNLPDNGIYRGEILKLTCNATGSNLNYNWFYKVCNMNTFCTVPVSGINFREYNNMYFITNSNFRNEWTCTFYDSICSSINSGNNIMFKNNLTEDPLKIYAGVTISNQFGSVTQYYNYNNNPESFHPVNAIRTPNPPVSGCPVLFVNTGEGYECENNILHKSNFPGNEGKDIEDRLVLINSPATDTSDNTLNLAIKETSSDINYIDEVRLISIIHPESLKVIITENNDIALMNENNIQSPYYAEINNADVTDELRYDSSFTKKVTGIQKDIINLYFNNKKSVSKINSNEELNPEKKYDSTVLLLDPFSADGQVINQKRPQANIYVTDTSGIYSNGNLIISRRSRQSVTSTVLNTLNPVGNIRMEFKEGFSMSYCALAELKFRGYVTEEFELTYALNSTGKSQYKLLKNKDNIYSVLDSSSFLTLKFKNLENNLQKGWKRDFIFVVKGRTIESGNDPERIFPFLNSLSEQINYPVENNKFYLEQNYPNPFNPKTIIHFQSAGGGAMFNFISLKVYDVLGNEIAVLVNENKKSGRYSVIFDGTGFASGIYYYKISATGVNGNYTQVRKMILLK